MRRFFYLVLCFVAIVGSYVTGAGLSYYNDVVLQNFEQSTTDMFTLRTASGKPVNYHLGIFDKFPAPSGNSTRYLGIVFESSSKDTIQIIPRSGIEINGFCKALKVWIYGYGGETHTIVSSDEYYQKHTINPGLPVGDPGWITILGSGRAFIGSDIKIKPTLYAVLLDANDKQYRLPLAINNWYGWRLAQAVIPPEVAREKKLLSQKASVKLIRFEYEVSDPGGALKGSQRWIPLLIDDIIVSVREENKDNQKEEW